MEKKKIRVLVVDDSALIREVLSDLIVGSDIMELVAVASSGRKALALLKQHHPDVITLDIQMPEMCGLETLDRILQQEPIPVVMVSALAKRAADVTMQALEKGAVDYVAKPENINSESSTWRDELLRKIQTAARTDVQRVLRIRADRKKRIANSSVKARLGNDSVEFKGRNFTNGLIAIGISTGGPPALNGLLESLRPPLPPMVIVQHMPKQFTGPFAERLNSVSELDIKEANSGDVLRPNSVLVASGGRHLHLRRKGNSVVVVVRDGEPVRSHKPSVDVMMNDAAETFGKHCLGVVMTGMGQDGVDGCGAILKAGGFVLGQDKESSDVYGMNKAAFVAGHVSRQFSLEELPVILNRQCKRMFSLG